MVRKIFLVLLVVVSASALFAGSGPLWMRYSAISPDGQTIAFSYKGDIYCVSAEGGRAYPLTFHEAYDFMPVWSPDSKTIAFASFRHGNYDVYIIPAQGGVPKRLTTHSAGEFPSTFTPDGKYVVFSAHIMDDYKNVQFPSGGLPELYKVSVKGGRPVQILTTPALDVCFNKQGTKIVYHDVKGYEDNWRKHHTSSVTRDVWMYDMLLKKYTKLTSFNGEDRNPLFSPDDSKIYYLSEKFGTFNVCSFPVSNTDNVTQITFFKRNPVRFLSVSDGGTLCFGFDGEIYTMKPGQKPAKVAIKIYSDVKENSVDYKVIRSGATDMAVSPDGKEVAFIVRGEVYVTSVDYSTTKQITKTPEQERSVSFSPDGRTLLYASERDGSWNVYKTSTVRDDEKHFYRSTLLKEEPVIATGKEEFQPAFSPDGKEVAYLEERTTLKVINLKTKKVRTVLPGNLNYSYSDGDQWYQWSPDGKWFLAAFSPNALFSNDVALISADGKAKIENLTNSGYSDGEPKWMMGGKSMIWFSDRQGLRSHGSWGAQSDVYAMFFTKKAWDEFNLSKEDYENYKEQKKNDEKDKKDKKDSDKSDKKEPKGKKEEKDKTEPLKINLKNIDDRVMRLTINSSNLADAVLSPDGEKLYYLSKFEGGHDLWVRNIRENETKLLIKLHGRGGTLHMDKKGETLFLFSGGKITKIEVGSHKRKPVSFAAEINLNNPAEKQYLFEHMWRQVVKKFYVKNLQNVDWNYYKKEYAKFLPYIDNNFDFAEMMSELLGELNASHTGCRYRPRVENGDRTASLGLFFDNKYNGNGLRVVEVIEKGPFDNAESKVKPVVILEKLDGTEIKKGMDYYPLLNHKAGKIMLVSFYDPALKTRWDEKIKPISFGMENQLLYERWVKQRREETERLSGGRLGYVHVRGMNSASFRKVYSEILGRNFHKEGLVVDTRFNGGGWLHDDLATLLNGKKYVDFVPRGQYYGYEPMNKWIKKSIVVMSESNYSDAHGFPFTYRALGIGKLVGMPVPGTMTAVWWERQQDPTLVFGIPQVGTKDIEGHYLENLQLEPDVKVAQDTEVVVNGRDQQIETAVKILLKDIDSSKK